MRVYVGLLVAVFLLTAVGAIAYLFVQSDRDGRREAQRAARSTARTSADQLGMTVAALRAAVKTVAAAPQIAQTFEHPEACTLQFPQQGGLNTGHVDILRPDGRVACSSRMAPQGSEPPAGYQGAPWLDRAERGELFEAPVVDAGAGGHAALATSPIPGGGTVAAFLALEPAARHLAELYGGGRPVEVLVTGADGDTVIARSIEPARWIGKSLEGTGFASAAGAVERPDVDGTTRVYAEAPVPGAGWRLFVGEDKEAVLAAAERLRNRQLAIILGGLLLMLAAAVVVYRRVAVPVTRLGAAVRSTSELSPPAPITASGPAEVTALGEDVNGLIASLHRELDERRRAEGERARLEGQLRQAQRMEAIGRLAGGVAHDFNNLLTAIMGNAELLLARTPPDDARRAEAEEVKKAGERAVALTRQLLTFGRSQALEPVVLDLNETIRGLEPMLRRLIRANITIATKLAPSGARIRVDRGQLEQVLVNLIVNAGDAMPDGGTLTIATSETDLDEGYFRLHPAGRAVPGRYAVLEVADNGVGMDEETLSHVFEPFFTTKGEEHGTGLGLATVYGIVRQSRGFVWAYSEPGQGTSFKVYLPLAAGAVEPTPASRPLPAFSADGRTVLLVEDDPAVRAIVRHMLELEGFTILEAEAGDGAIALSDEGEPGSLGLLVTDTIVPGPGGVELAKRLRRRHPELPTLIMSGYTDPTAEGPLGPATEFIAKPFSAADLRAKLATLLT